MTATKRAYIDEDLVLRHHEDNTEIAGSFECRSVRWLRHPCIYLVTVELLAGDGNHYELVDYDPDFDPLRSWLEQHGINLDEARCASDEWVSDA